MSDIRTFKIEARKFVTEALTETSGRKPSEKTIKITVERIVKAFEPIMIGKSDKSLLQKT